ncbi:MAG: sugar phosphate isomerase/epimerase family protein [Actinomycetota bacterium]
MSRRRLIGLGTGVVAAAVLAPSVLGKKVAGATTLDPDPPCVPPSGLLPEERIGIQLYTVRDRISSLGFAKVFETLAATGFKEVEFAGYTQGSVGPITVQQIRQLMDDNGLRAVGSHASLTTANVQQKLDEAQILGMASIGNATTSSSSPTLSGWQAAADTYNQIGEACAARGLKFYLHNHQTEFAPIADQPTTRVYDVLLAETEADKVYFEMDIYWAYVGQYLFSRPPFGTFDPQSYLTAQPHRFPLFHVKDGKSNAQNPQGYDMVDVGQGNIDFQTFFKKLDAADLPNHSYLNERDDANGHPHGSLSSGLASYWWMRRGLKP